MKNPTVGSKAVPYGRTDGRKDRRADMIKLIVTFRSVARAPKKYGPHMNSVTIKPECANRNSVLA